MAKTPPPAALQPAPARPQRPASSTRPASASRASRAAPRAATDPPSNTDRELIALLQANARESTANLARRLGVARTTVVARLQRLERDGQIAGYTVRLARDIERPAVQAHVAIALEPKRGRDVVRRLQRLPELQWLASVSGEFDCVAVLRAESTARLDALLDEIGEIDGVLRTQSSIVLAVKVDRS